MIVRESMKLMLGDWVLFLVPVILLAVWMIVRRLGWLPKGRAFSGSPSMGSRISHRAEAIILLCVAGTIFVLAATNTSTGGRLLILDQLSPAFARANVLAAAGAGLGVVIGALVALFYRTSTGVIVAAGVLCIYGLVLNGPADILEPPVSKKSSPPDISLVFTLIAPDAEGAELYVNDVHLGTLPYKTTYEEFHRKVPVRESDSLGSRQPDYKSWLSIPTRWNPGSRQPGASLCPPSQEFCLQVPKRVRGMWRVGTKVGPFGPAYYARVKLGDEWGYWCWIGHGDYIAGESERNTVVVPLGFVFPVRKKRIETLLDVVRLNDYSPTSAWFEAMDTYGSDGWLALRRAVDKEPRMGEVLDLWAAWKYDLDSVTDSTSAWRVFEKIRSEADRRQYYMTSDVAGRAVELLTPKLDEDKLVRFARPIMRSTRFCGWYAWEMNGRTQFGMNFGSAGFSPGQDRISGYPMRVRGFGSLSPGDYAVAHAVWMLDEMLDAKDDKQPNLVERELVPVFVAWNYNDMNRLPLAAGIAGDAIERYLLRQDWRAEPDNLPREYRVQAVGITEVNGWLYLLADLQSAAGRQFRRDNPYPLMELADQIVGPAFGTGWYSGIDFLFLDLDLGPESLAMRYWPRFKEKASQHKQEALSLQYRYLVRMEPLSTVEMYVQCWRESRFDSSTLRSVLGWFGRSGIPYAKRRQIYAGLSSAIERGLTKVEPTFRRNEEDFRRELLGNLDNELLPITDVERVGDLLAALRAGDATYPPESVAAWLAHSEPSHPLVRMLAEANEPSLRLLAMGALRRHPTPDNRAILAKLLADADEQVRSAAEGVAKELAALKETPVAQFADKRTGPVVP